MTRMRWRLCQLQTLCSKHFVQVIGVLKLPTGRYINVIFVQIKRRNYLRNYDCILKRSYTESAFLLTKNSHFCGAVKTNILTVLGHAASIIRLDGDSVCLVSEDRKQGLLVDQNIDDPEQTYELTVWGHRWASAVSYCDSGG